MKALLGKEWLESKRTLKIIWLPIVFIILGLTQPLLVKYMPEILKAVGGIENPDALIQLMGQQTPESILGQTLASQYDQMGIIIFAIAAMGAISADRSSEMLAFIMTRPVRMASYIGSKWISEFVAAFSVLTAGYIFSAYYTFLLFGKFNIWHASLAFGIYFVWFAFFDRCCHFV
ncbi:ABC transporter permease subunit [Listeria floridensis]|uniref:ABC transporter permease subunit n=1 Tax=Listeria floridensis TaxID=1494962 RepID=UPI0004B7C0DE|nr:ABC transporter permease subunit [Listeria floridensis]